MSLSFLGIVLCFGLVGMWIMFYYSVEYFDLRPLHCHKGLLRPHYTPIASDDTFLEKFKHCGNLWPVWLDRHNALILFTIILNFWQLAAVSFLPSIYLYPENSFFLTKFFNYSFLNFDNSADNYYLIEFWSVIGLVVIWLAVSNLLSFAIQTEDWRPIHGLPGGSCLIYFLTSSMFLYICQNLLAWVACSYPEEPVQDSDPTAVLALITHQQVVCYDGQHQAYAVVALFAFLLYIWSGGTIGIGFLNDLSTEVDIQFKESFVILERILWLTMLIITIFFHQTVWLPPLAGLISYSILAWRCVQSPELPIKYNSLPCTCPDNEVTSQPGSPQPLHTWRIDIDQKHQASSNALSTRANLTEHKHSQLALTSFVVDSPSNSASHIKLGDLELDPNSPNNLKNPNKQKMFYSRNIGIEEPLQPARSKPSNSVVKHNNAIKNQQHDLDVLPTAGTSLLVKSVQDSSISQAKPMYPNLPGNIMSPEQLQKSIILSPLASTSTPMEVLSPKTKQSCASCVCECSVYQCLNSYRVCNVPFICYLKGLGYILLLWGCVVSLSASMLSEPQDTWLPFGILITGGSIIVALSIGWACGSDLSKRIFLVEKNSNAVVPLEL